MSHRALDLTLMEGASVIASWHAGGPFQSPPGPGRHSAMEKLCLHTCTLSGPDWNGDP